MGLKLVPIGLLVLIALASQVNSQSWYSQNQNPTYDKPVQDNSNLQSKQLFTGKKLTWRYPDITIDEPAGVEVVLVVLLPADSIQIQVEEQQVQVAVNMDFFNTGQLINPADMSLGGCAAIGVDPDTNRLLFQSELQACGSVLTTTSEELIYTFTLIYIPTPFPGTSIVRTTGAMVGIEAHYQRYHNVSSGALFPNWIPYSATKQGEELLIFSLRLMMENWETYRDTTQFNLGDMIYIEAFVYQFYHVPLRVFVDNCVATTTSDANSSPNYAFIDNHGCFTDAKLTGSNSRFVQRSQDDKLKFMLEAFRFVDSGTIYITCRLKATASINPRDSKHKACSYTNGGWFAAGGPNDLCNCCESGCAGGGVGDDVGGGQQKNQQGELWGEATIGPYYVTKKST